MTIQSFQISVIFWLFKDIVLSSIYVQYIYKYRLRDSKPSIKHLDLYYV